MNVDYNKVMILDWKRVHVSVQRATCMGENFDVVEQYNFHEAILDTRDN